jgi:hypothetical protein
MAQALSPKTMDPTCRIQDHHCVDTKRPFWYLHEAIRTCRPPAGDWVFSGRISDFFTTLPLNKIWVIIAR